MPFITSIHNVRIARGLPCFFNEGSDHPGCICELATRINGSTGDASSVAIMLAAGEPVTHATTIRIKEVVGKLQTAVKKEPVKMPSGHRSNKTDTVQHTVTVQPTRAEFDGEAIGMKIQTVQQLRGELAIVLDNAEEELIQASAEIDSKKSRPSAVFRVTMAKRIRDSFAKLIRGAKKLVEAVEDDGHLDRIIKSSLADLAEEEKMTGPDFSKFAKE